MIIDGLFIAAAIFPAREVVPLPVPLAQAIDSMLAVGIWARIFRHVSDM